jgi:hypothetical protein
MNDIGVDDWEFKNIYRENKSLQILVFILDGCRVVEQCAGLCCIRKWWRLGA